MEQCPDCKTYMQWHSAWNVGMPSFWYECPKCGYRTNNMRTYYTSPYTTEIPQNYYSEVTFPNKEGWTWLD